MKKIILLLLLGFGMNMVAQEKISVDSITLFNPINGHKIINLDRPTKNPRLLDSLNKVHRTDRFISVIYYSNGRAVQCTIGKVKKEPVELIL